MLQKAHVQGDIHPNGKWYWESSAAGGKGDWRVIKKTASPTKQKSKFAKLTEEEMMAELIKTGNINCIINWYEKAEIVMYSAS